MFDITFYRKYCYFTLTIYSSEVTDGVESEDENYALRWCSQPLLNGGLHSGDVLIY